MSELEPRSGASSLEATALALLLATGFASPPLLVVGASFGVLHPVCALLGLCGAFAGWVWLIVGMRRGILAKSAYASAARTAADWLVLAIAPLWGLAYNFAFGEASCVSDGCQPDVFRPLAAPGVYVLVGLHAAVGVAYAISRRRPEALRPTGELLLCSILGAGVLVHAVVAAHFGSWLLVGLALPPVFFPCLAPLLTVCLLGVEIRARLRRRGGEALAAGWIERRRPAYRDAERSAPEAPLVVHRGLLLRVLVTSPALVGAYAVLHALAAGRPAAALEVFTKTCTFTLSQVDVTRVPGGCHYLCTVAARGHTWLVRPERVGRRRGTPILVNRQLATANAFEDLLHERWPRFGRLARRTYDALGLPVSRLIRWPWLADLVYLAMKPAEWAFSVALLLFDRRSPQERIDRMYR